MKRLYAISILASALPAAFGQMGCIDRYLTDPLIYTNIVTSADQVNEPRDLDFKPNSNELWVMLKGGTDGGSMVIVHNAGLIGQTDEYRKDTHSSHFMVQASAMAFSDNGEWGAVSEIQNTNSNSPTPRKMIVSSAAAPMAAISNVCETSVLGVIHLLLGK